VLSDAWIFNRTEFGHIAIAIQWGLRLRFPRRLVYLPQMWQLIPEAPYGDRA